MASAVCQRESAIEATASSLHAVGAKPANEPLKAAWHMIVGPLKDDVSDERYLAATRSLLNIAPATPDSEAEAEFSAILRMKREPLVLDEVEAAAYAGLQQRRAPRVGDPLSIE